MARLASSVQSRSTSSHGPSSLRPVVLTASNLVLLLFANFARAAPLVRRSFNILEDDDLPKSPHDPNLWAYLGTAIALVLLGGAFAGLTIALMGQDEIYLQVIATSGEGAERKNAKRVLGLLKKGKHWVLVTLLLSNVITNETLPIVLDRSLGGGWPAVVSSTVLIVIFGEIVPQSICVRYGLPIGAWTAPFVLALMYLMAPVAWPTAKLLDWLLGEDHGTTYKKAGLKTLVTLHKTLGSSPADRLNEDEVTIISAVLDLKDKPVGNIMTPMADVFTLSANAVLDEEMMDTILSAGYSRIPIHTPDNPTNFVGMLLVKMLITYDPEDALRVRDFALATLPETRPETSCLDIVNFFQEGKSHMVLVSDYPGEAYGALGVVTLEDVIEELIGEEIIDESDVFVDIHKAIRRMAPAPRTRVPKGHILNEPAMESGEHPETTTENRRRSSMDGASARKMSGSEFSSSPRATTFFMRRRSNENGSADSRPGTIPIRSTRPEIQEHLKHLGPSNAANRPKQTRIPTVKIKPGVPTIPESSPTSPKDQRIQSASVADPAPHGGVGEGLLSSAGKDASDGALAVATGYGTMHRGSPVPTSSQDASANGNGSPPRSAAGSIKSDTIVVDRHHQDHRPLTSHRTHSESTVGSLISVESGEDKPGMKKRLSARSGSITENIIDVHGVRKVILETNSSSDEREGLRSRGLDGTHEVEEVKKGGEHGKDAVERDGEGEGDGATGGEDRKSKKKRKKRAGKKKKGGQAGSAETRPLLR